MRATRLLALCLTFVLAACGKKAGEDSTEAPAAAPVKVQLVVATKKLVPQQAVLSGVVTADQRAEVTADTAGKVIDVMVERGKRVKQGAEVVRLDVRSAALGAREAAANLASARAQRELAEEECRRTKMLFDKGAIGKSEFDRQTAACTSALQQVSAAEARTQMMAKSVADGIVRAPFDGVVTEKMVAPGEWVAPGKPLFTLVDDDPLKLEVSVPEVGALAVKAAKDLAPDLRIDVVAVSEPDVVWGAKLTRIGGEIGRTRSLIVEAEIEKGARLVPGMFAEARVPIGVLELPVVPKDAVKGKCEQRPTIVPGKFREVCRGPWRAFVVVKGELEERIVQIGARPSADEVSIVDGIKPGEKVVAKIDDKIVDGLRVVE